MTYLGQLNPFAGVSVLLVHHLKVKPLWVSRSSPCTSREDTTWFYCTSQAPLCFSHAVHQRLVDAR